MPQEQWTPPAIGDAPVQEGARWRHHRPPSEAVAHWFATQPLDDGMDHERFVGGVVIIPQSEKVKYSRPDGGGTVERYEQVFTPYVQIGTRVAYFRMLAEMRELIPVIRPTEVPRSDSLQSPYFNANMPDGLWWHVVRGDNGNAVRYLCATYEVAMYEPVAYAQFVKGERPLPRLSGSGTKQVGGGADANGLMKAQTGAIGRALGVAGILVVGTGIATAEDMQEFTGQAAQAPSPESAQLPSPTELPPGEQPPAMDELESLRARALEIQTRLQEERPERWAEVAAWYSERAREAGWKGLQDVPLEAMKGLIARMERAYASEEVASA